MASSLQQLVKHIVSLDFTIYTPFMKEDNILFTVNVSNSANAENGNQHRLLLSPFKKLQFFKLLLQENHTLCETLSENSELFGLFRKFCRC